MCKIKEWDGNMSLFSQLKNLQWKQLQHDEKYHKEICLLTVQRRITHMTLHLSKYSAKIIKAATTEDYSTLRKSLVDTVIIIFSSANIFNHFIWSNFKTEQEQAINSLKELGKSIADRRAEGKYGLPVEISIDIVSTTGAMCKTVESLDHLEAYPFRENLIQSLGVLFEQSISLAYLIGIEDIPSEISERLYTVEKKNPYFEELGNYKEGYR